MLNIIKFIKKLFFRVGSIFYVGATDVLPEPLSRDEEEYYVKLKDQGDINAKDKLIEHNLRLVAHIIKKYESKYVSNDDLISIGTIGLIKGVNTYKLDKNIKHNIIVLDYPYVHLYHPYALLHIIV